MNARVAELTYALDRENHLVSIENVPSGLTCGCTCPSCHAALVARKGDVKVHYFAHYNNTSCVTGYQTSVHLLAKEIIQKDKVLTIPYCGNKIVTLKGTFCEYLEITNNTDCECSTYIDYNGDTVYRTMDIIPDNVSVEVCLDDIIPDIIVEKGGRKLFVEIYVTHKVDSEKLMKIKQHNIAAMEIDLHDLNSETLNEDTLRKEMKNPSRIYWLYNPKIETYIAQRKQRFSQKQGLILQYGRELKL